MHSCVSAGLLHSVHLGHTKSLPWTENQQIFNISLLRMLKRKTRRTSATTQLRRADMREDLGAPQTEEGFVGLAEQSSHRRKPWPPCCPEMAPGPPFPLSSSCPCEGFAFRKRPAITQMTLCFNIVLKMKKHPHVTPSHMPPSLPSPKTTTAIEPEIPSTGEGYHRVGATAHWRWERDNVWTLCRFLRGLTYPKIQRFSALTARQYVTSGIAGHAPSQRTSSSDNNNNKETHPKNLYAKSVYTIAFAKEKNKVYDNCSTGFRWTRKKTTLLLQASTKREALLEILSDKMLVILKSHLSRANVKKGLKQIQTWTFLL